MRDGDVATALRGPSRIPAGEDGAGELQDLALLDRATELNRALFTQDDESYSRSVSYPRFGESHFSASSRVMPLRLAHSGTVGLLLEAPEV